MFTRLKDMVRSLPWPMQQGFMYIYGAIPPRLRYERVFWDYYRLLQKSQWWSRQELEEYQMKQLSRLLSHAYANVPYYSHVFKERHLKPEDIRSYDDLQKLPYLTKEILRERLPEFVASNYPASRLQSANTGGSSGIPVSFYYEKGATGAIQLAFIVNQWSRVGYQIGDRCVLLAGAFVGRSKKNKYWHYNPVDKLLSFSVFHMTDKTLPGYVKKIREFKPDFIRAYPSAITLLAQFMTLHKIEPFQSVKAVLCGSERLYPWQRNLIEEVFHCRAYSWYGHTEMAVLAGECEQSNDYHIFPEYGLVEIIGDNDRPVTEDNHVGVVVATNLHNFVCPLIRYRTDDLATYSSEVCTCGRHYPLIKEIEGRLQEYVVTKDKRKITLTALIFGQHFSAFNRLKGMQLVQDVEGQLMVRLVPTAHYSNADEQEILSKLQGAVGTGLDIRFEYVSDIPRTKMGKQMFLIQELGKS